MTLASANAAVLAGALFRGFSSDAMFPDVEQEEEKKISISLAWGTTIISHPTNMCVCLWY